MTKHSIPATQKPDFDWATFRADLSSLQEDLTRLMALADQHIYTGPSELEVVRAETVDLLLKAKERYTWDGMACVINDSKRWAYKGVSDTGLANTVRDHEGGVTASGATIGISNITKLKLITEILTPLLGNQK